MQSLKNISVIKIINYINDGKIRDLSKLSDELYFEVINNLNNKLSDNCKVLIKFNHVTNTRNKGIDEFNYLDYDQEKLIEKILYDDLNVWGYDGHYSRSYYFTIY